MPWGQWRADSDRGTVESRKQQGSSVWQALCYLDQWFLTFFSVSSAGSDRGQFRSGSVRGTVEGRF